MLGLERHERQPAACARSNTHEAKKEFAVAGLVLAIVALTVLHFSHSHNPWVNIVANLVAGVSLGVFNMLIWAFSTAAVIDFQKVRTGQCDDGRFYATYSWLRKVGQAASGGLSGVVLTFIGYKATTGAHVQQAVWTLEVLFALSAIVPGAFYLVREGAPVVWPAPRLLTSSARVFDPSEADRVGTWW